MLLFFQREIIKNLFSFPCTSSCGGGGGGGGCGCCGCSGCSGVGSCSNNTTSTAAATTTNKLVLLGKGLGSDIIKNLIVKIHSIPECLMILIDSAATGGGLEDISFHVGPSKRRELYLRGGVIPITPRLLINDLLREVLPAHLITTILISSFEECQIGGLEAFAIRIIRERNLFVNIICLSDSPLILTEMERRMREFNLQHIMLYPRFHDSVIQSLSNGNDSKVDLEEIYLPMPKIIRKLQVTLLDLLEGLFREISKIVGGGVSGGSASLTLESLLVGDLLNDLKFDGFRLNQKAKEIREELLSLRYCLLCLSSHPFHSIKGKLKELREGGEAWFTLLPSYPLLHEIIYKSDDDDDIMVKDLKIEFLKVDCPSYGDDGYIVLCERTTTKEALEGEGLVSVLFSDFTNSYNGKVLYLYENNLSFIRKIELMEAEFFSSELRIIKVLSYKDSMEEEKNLLEIREEKRIFENLIIRSPNYNLKQPPLQTQIGDGKGMVIVDMRELRSQFPFSLYKNGFNLRTQTLKIADYILTPKCSIERKSLPDFIQSMRSGRLYEQMKKMNRLYELPILLLEFSEDLVFGMENQISFIGNGEINNLIRGIVMLCISFERMRIIWSPSLLMTNHVFEDLKRGEDEPAIIDDVDIDGNSIAIIEDDSMEEEKEEEEDIANDILIKLVGSTFATSLIRAGAQSLLDVVSWKLERIEEAVNSRMDAFKIYRIFNDKISLL